MIFAPLPPNENQRLEAIEEFDLRSDDLQDELQTIATIAASSLKMSMAFITIVDRDVMHLKAKVGSETKQLDRRKSICSHTILRDHLFEIPDLKLDARFIDSADAAAHPFARFYAGVPLKLRTGVRVGTLCVFDNQPRKLSLDEKITLQGLVKIIVSLFESRKKQQVSSERESHLQNNAADAVQKLSARTDYLAFITHELRTPISGIISITDALFETEIQQSQREHLTTILQSSRHLMSLTNDILDFSKIEAGKMSVKTDSFDLEALLKQTLRTFHFAALNKNVQLDLVFDLDYQRSNKVPYFSDAQRIAQILTNLVGNALKFTERGHVKVAVKITPLSSAGPRQPLGQSVGHSVGPSVQRSIDHHRVQILVIDTGIGMDLETQKNLFQLYSQGDSSIQQRFGGTGLGLAISRKLAKLLNGDLSCTSIKGVGSTFTLDLQLDLKMPSQPSEIDDESEAKSAKVRSLLGRNIETIPLLPIPFNALRILVAEDNEISQRVIAAMLKKSGCRFQMVSDGASAIEAFEASQFDAVLLDCHMPKLDGFQAARRIRQIASQRDIHTPIFGITASSRTHENTNFMDAGMDETIEKPFSQVDLHLKITRWISAALEEPAA